MKDLIENQVDLLFILIFSTMVFFLLLLNFCRILKMRICQLFISFSLHHCFIKFIILHSWTLLSWNLIERKHTKGKKSNSVNGLVLKFCSFPYSFMEPLCFTFSLHFKIFYYSDSKIDPSGFIESSVHGILLYKYLKIASLLFRKVIMVMYRESGI